MNIKDKGQIFTPSYIVNHLLDLSGYKVGKKILRKHIIDNSCGNGAILSEVVDRYCQSYMFWNENVLNLKDELEQYIHGIDIDDNLVNDCISTLNNICSNYGVFDIQWDIKQGNALTETRFNKRMDFVIGNPPYVRTHNLNQSYDMVKNFMFTQDGASDLYLTFFELGINMLNKTGRLCYITPSSWTTSKTGKIMRTYFKNNKLIKRIVDMESHEIFDNVSVYTMITLLDKSHNDNTFSYYRYNEEDKTIYRSCTLNINDIEVNDNFYFADNIKLLQNVNNVNIDKKIIVKNGVATLLDKVFIKDDFPFLTYTRRILKASTGEWKRCFFPYDDFGNPLPPSDIKEYKNIMVYLEEYKEELLKRKCDNNIVDWFYYGRSQGLKDIFRERIAINNLIKDVDTIKINHIPEGCVVYSGLYIYSDTFNVNEIEDLLKTNDFVEYVKSLKKYKNGGYYTFNSKDLENYLNYKINYVENKSC